VSVLGPQYVRQLSPAASAVIAERAHTEQGRRLYTGAAGAVATVPRLLLACRHASGPSWLAHWRAAASRPALEQLGLHWSSSGKVEEFLGGLETDHEREFDRIVSLVTDGRVLPAQPPPASITAAQPPTV
jgi:hypothetical protein